MNRSIAFGAGLALAAGLASARPISFPDATFDLFDNGFDNLDIVGVIVDNDATNLYMAVETRGYTFWTKYMMYFDTAAGGTGSNAWARPVDLNGQLIEHFVGSWVDQPNNNQQNWSWDGANWNMDSLTSNDQSQTGVRVVGFTIPLAFLGVGIGDTIYFDVATSGGGNDPGVDHLSRSDPATPGWGTPSVAGPFLPYQIIPTPGALSVLGLAALAATRRRRA